MQDRTATQRLADEIYHVYFEIRKIIPDVHRRIGRADPTWIFLEPEKSDSTEKQATMRDYVLYQYATAERSSNPSISTIKQQVIKRGKKNS